jgi:hypothetical protein
MRWMLASLALLTLPAQAAVPDYDFAEALAYRVNNLGGDVATGLQLNGSYDLAQGFYLEGTASDVHDNAGSGTNAQKFLAGPGFRAHTEIVDVFLSVDYLHIATSGGSSASQDGYRWVWGLRSGVTDRLELNTGIEKSSVGQTETGVRFGESYRFGDRLTFRAQYIHFHDGHNWVMGLRYIY